ncbi:MAG: sodium-dependent transporter [Gammaproteobacteria bacterium]
MIERPQFSSRFVAILTVLGASIGLGNVWRFPYMMGKTGGSAFLAVYLLFTLLIAVPAMTAEWSLGRHTRRGPIGAFAHAFGNRIGTPIGYALLVVVGIALSYYIVVIANVIYTTAFATLVGFSDSSFKSYRAGLDNGWLQYAICLGVLFGSLYVVHRGLRLGIEKVSRVFVPVFFIVVIALVLLALSLPGATDKLVEFLQPDFSSLGVNEIFLALGQSVFSLGLGATILLMYGSYMRAEDSLLPSAFIAGLGDTAAALLASMLIVPAVLVFGLDLSAGPQLIFDTLPRLFAAAPQGNLLGSVFLVALTLMAFLSAVAPLEAIIGELHQTHERRFSRRQVIVAMGVLQALLIFPSALRPELIGILDLVFGAGMQALGTGLAAVALTWALGRGISMHQLFSKPEGLWQTLYFQWLKWVVPGTVFTVLAGYVYSLT